MSNLEHNAESDAGHSGSCHMSSTGSPSQPPHASVMFSASYQNPNGSTICVAGHVPTNGASFLLGRSMRLINRAIWHTLLTYADTRQGHTGAIYRATNWTYLGVVPGSDAWVDANGVQRGRKRGGRNIPADEMRRLGFTRLPPSSKHKYVHRTNGVAA